MSPDLIFNTGIIICGAAVIFTIIAVIILRFLKTRLNRQLDSEYGKRRRFK